MKEEKVGSRISFYYDTYALYAIAKGEKTYEKYSKGHIVVTSLMNIYEFYYLLIKENQEDLALQFFNRLISSCAKITPDIIKESAKFRYKEIKKKFSYVDCLGYTIAKNKGVKFLTGDDGFKNMENVEFMK